MILASGNCWLIAPHASMPLDPPRRMSIMITSGLWAWLLVIASAAEAASATTSMSARRSIRAFSPMRTTS